MINDMLTTIIQNNNNIKSKMIKIVSSIPKIKCILKTFNECFPSLKGIVDVISIDPLFKEWFKIQYPLNLNFKDASLF